MCNDLKECLKEEHKDDKRHIYEYPENDLDQTKVMTAVDVKKESKNRENDGRKRLVVCIFLVLPSQKQ